MLHPATLHPAIFLAILLVLVSRTAVAQPESLRTQLVTQAAGAHERGQHAEAVRLLRAALSIRSSPGTRWALAFELHQMGEFQEAGREAEACVEEATGAGPDAITARDECEAIRVRARDRVRVEVQPEALPPSISPPALPVSVLPTPHPAGSAAARPVGPGPAVLVAVGGASLVATAVLWGLRASTLAPCSNREGTLYCRTQEDLDTARSGSVYTTAGWATLGVGMAAIGTGTLWWLLGRRAQEAPVTVAVGMGSVAVEGRF